MENLKDQDQSKKEIAISETVSENKKKRGRPSVYKRDHEEDIGKNLEVFDGHSHRTHVAEYYRATVFGLLESHSEIPYLEKIFMIGYGPSGSYCLQKDLIIEQFGRMLVQDGYDEETVIEAATLAARFYHNGNTVKEIAAYLRRVRKAKSWDV